MTEGRSDLEAGLDPETAPVELEITDVLDLHSFPPDQVADVLRDWLDAAWEVGFQICG